MTREIARIETPLSDITDRSGRRLVEELGRVEILGKPCKLMWGGGHLEFWTHGRRYQICMDDLFATAGFAIERDLTGDIARRVLAARGVEPASDTTAH